MSPKFINFEITLIYILLLIPWPHSNVIKLLCSKDNSRLVRKIIRSKWTPILEKYQVKLPLECPLHPFRDVFGPRQDAKKRDRPTQWTCRLCGKSFYQERYVDIHFETRHRSVLNEAEDAVCFADFCDIMRCEVFQSEEASLTGGDTHIVTDIEVWGNSLGQSSALAKANAAYLSLIPLRSSALGATRASKVQNRQLCPDKSSQNKFKDISKEPEKELNSEENTDESKKSSSSSSSANHSSMKIDPLVQSNTSEETNNKTINGSSVNIQKVRANCRTEDLNKLKSKCEYLLRSCIAGLLLQMTDHAFKEMEEEMNKAVCWYLSCDRYWEDGPLEPRAFPWGLILILVMVLSLGICFCYYIIWILFDSEEMTISNNVHRYDYHHYPPQHHSSPRYITGPPSVVSHHLTHHPQQEIYERREVTTRLPSTAVTMVDCDTTIGGKYSSDLPTTTMRPPSSTDIQNDLAHNEHYIYVTYPPDLKKRLFEKYE